MSVHMNKWPEKENYYYYLIFLFHLCIWEEIGPVTDESLFLSSQVHKVLVREQICAWPLLQTIWDSAGQVSNIQRGLLSPSESLSI